jgi:gamma-glutamylcyclotransferase (GGCT)/AIG2-like uncharacterized protein YtfP
MPELLFIYGTLHPNRAPAEIASAVRRLKSLGPATIHAKLYDLGEYPGIVLDHSASHTVAGELFAVPDAETLTLLDAYEDFRPHDPAHSLFLRTQTTATLPDGSSLTCWVYVYNRDPPSDPQSSSCPARRRNPVP